MRNPVESEVILASAGTGKTHALTTRILRLFALGVAPETVLALTFTRKAAGEFARVVFRRLARAAADDSAARQLAADLAWPAAGRGDFSALLARVVRSMDRLQFQTFDAFFQRVVNAMPFDLGLAGGVQMLTEADSAEMRRRVLARLLAASGDPAAQSALLTAYRDATWGAEEKALHRKLDAFIFTNHARFLEAPEPDRWGDVRAIWPEGSAWLEEPPEVEPAARALAEWAQPREGEIFRSLEAFAAAARDWNPGMKLPTGRVAEQIFGQFAEDPVRTDLTLQFRRARVDVDSAVVPVIRHLVARFVTASLRRHLRVTSGLHRVLEPFDRTYHAEVRLAGWLAFADVVEMLRRVPPLEWQARLDARLDHWLFDEFQDTSLAQWSVVENLVDEVLQDDSGRRSAFFVGDPKQSIYRWRGGEHRLLPRILKRYGAGIRSRELLRSYRSDPAVIELINRYGRAAGDPGNGLPPAVTEEWRGFWGDHVSASPERAGHATVDRLENQDEFADRLLAELQRIDPIRRGLTCAVLTLRNNDARDLAAALRERGFFHVTAETDEPVAIDAPVNRALLALVSAVAHPADSASAAAVEMSPLRALLEPGGWPALRRRFLGEVTSDGMESALRSAAERALDGHAVDAFTRQRLRLLFALAREFDANGTADPDEFLRRAQAHQRRQVASPANVQILTIHRSKGLGFDVVFLPVFETSRMDAAPRDPFLSRRGPDLETRWLLHRPAAAIAAMDPGLREAFERQVHDDAYDALCVWYVALTRAKRALHIFTVAPGQSGGTSPVMLLHRALDGTDPDDAGRLWSAGSPRWLDPRP